VRPEWREHIAELTEQFAQARSGLLDAQRRAAELTATARDADGRLSVTVDHQGRLTAVELEPGATGLPAAELGALIVAASRAAAAKIDTQRAELIAPSVPDEVRERLDAVRDEHGRLDLARMFPDPYQEPRP
jgi:DNA-binding protein YbaB